MVDFKNFIIAVHLQIQFYQTKQIIFLVQFTIQEKKSIRQRFAYLLDKIRTKKLTHKITFFIQCQKNWHTVFQSAGQQIKTGIRQQE